MRRELSPRRRFALTLLAFILPLAAWSAISYIPWLWHPLVRVTAAGDGTFLEDQLVEKCAFAAANAALLGAGKVVAAGDPANPVFLSPPHAVARALITGFTTPLLRKNEPWLHESLLHSVRLIAWGFGLSVIAGVPLGILCGSFRFVSYLFEPFVDFIRYMPAPAFGALAVAVFGINDEPKIAIIVIIVISSFFCTVLVVANTARLVDRSLLEAAQTLGAGDRQLLTRVIVPAMLPQLYNDLRILLGSAWTALIVAELIGASSGISYFINQQGKYRNYDNVFAGIILIGMVGLITDQILAYLSRFIFPGRMARMDDKKSVGKTPSNPIALEVRDLGKTFPRHGGGDATALAHLNFSVHRREFVTVVGPFGCGKSTLVRILAGLEGASSGVVLVDGAPVTGPGSDRGMVFQGYTLFPWLTVLRNVMFGLRLRGMGFNAARSQALEWIEMVGLTRFADAYPHQLSGGMKQRVAIARAIANQPRVLLMDEFFGARDPKTRLQMQSHLLQIWRNVNITVVFITHDLDEAALLADRIVVLGAPDQQHIGGHLVEILTTRFNRERDIDIARDPGYATIRHQLEHLVHPPPLAEPPPPLPLGRMTPI